MTETVSLETTGDVAILRIDDGKANALSPAVLEALGDALDQAEQGGQAVVLTGRPGCFSAGFDLSVMREGGPDAARALVDAGARVALRLARFPAPVVIGCSGHAIAMGAVLLSAVDTRIGARGDFKIGYNEVAIGMTTPIFLLELARERISKRHFLPAVVQANVYGPDGALDAGFLDQLAEPDAIVETSLAQAERLAKLPRGAYLRTRALARGANLDNIEAGIEADLSTF